MESDYNNLCILDLDGVLIHSRELHYDALNRALKLVCGESIGREEHLSLFDGLSTNRKLKILASQGRVSEKFHAEVAKVKQEETVTELQKLAKNPKLIQICDFLQSQNFKIAVASNAIRSSVRTALVRLGIMEYVEIFISNEDVIRNKPHPSPYWTCMEACNAVPRTTIIVEDSHIGRQGAIESGATLIPVNDPDDLTLEKIREAVDHMANKPKPRIPWRDKNLTVVIPMSGAGSRFVAAGYTFPKPLIEVKAKAMIQVVLDNLNVEAGRYVFIVQREHAEKYGLMDMLTRIVPVGAEVMLMYADGVTEGAACSVLLAKAWLDNDRPLLMANSDQFVEWNSNECMYAWSADAIDGGILTFKSNHPKWSYARLDDNGFVAEVAEKKVISDNATVGIYYWKHGRDFVKYAEQMIAKNIRVNNEFYVAPVFNEAIAAGKRIRIKEAGHMWGLGDPDSLEYFLKTYEGNV